MKLKLILFLFLCILQPIKAFNSDLFYLHKFYTSITQVEFNPQTKSLECVMNVFIDDLELALSKKFNKTITLENVDFKEFTKKYLKDVFKVKSEKGLLKDILWIGMESDKDKASLYFEIENASNYKKFYYQNEILISYFPDQVNFVNFVNQNPKKTLIFKNGTSFLKYE